MKALLTRLLTLILIPVSGCGLDMKLELGTVALQTKLSVDEWAQANVLKALDELITEDEESDSPDPADEKP